MRPPALIFSVLVHGGAIGAFAVVGAYASERTREAPRVEILTSIASSPAAARVPAERELAPTVVVEASPLPAELPDDPIVSERLSHRAVLEDPVAVDRPLLRVSAARIVPPAIAEQIPVAPVAPAEVVEPPPAQPASASVHVAASPRADNLPPRYPDRERALGREGTVVLHVVVDRHGDVIDAELVAASYPGFNRAALSAVREWRFEPGMRDGVAVEDRIPVTIEFRLEDAR